MTIAFMRVLHRSNFSRGWKLREQAFSVNRRRRHARCVEGNATDRAFKSPPLHKWGGSRPSRSVATVPLAEVRFKKRGSHGCERQIRLRRADPSLGSLSRPGQVAATARNLRAGGTDCGLLVQ